MRVISFCKLWFLLTLLALLNLAVDGHRKFDEPKCECDEEDAELSKIFVERPCLFLSHGETTLVTVHCGLAVDKSVPVEADWIVSGGPSFVDVTHPSGPTSVFTLGVRPSASQGFFDDWREDVDTLPLPIKLEATPIEPAFLKSSTEVILRIAPETPVRYRKGEAKITIPPGWDFAHRFLPPFDQFFGEDVQEKDGEVTIKLYHKQNSLPAELLKHTKDLQRCYVKVLMVYSFSGGTSFDIDPDSQLIPQLLTIPIEVPCS